MEVVSVGDVATVVVDAVVGRGGLVRAVVVSMIPKQ